MRALFINASKGTVEEVQLPEGNGVGETEHDPWFQEVYRLLEAETFVSIKAGGRHRILLDGEALLHTETPKPRWKFDRYPLPLLGNAICVGVDPESGDEGDCILTPEGLKASIQFFRPINGG